MSRVNVDFVAFGDVRFVRLAADLGYADHDHARSKVEYLWLECTRRCTTKLPRWVVESILGPEAPAALIKCGLARWAGGRGDSEARPMYICGARERCLWLGAKLDQTSKAGKARAQSAQRVAGRFAPAVAGGRAPAVAGRAAGAPATLTSGSRFDAADSTSAKPDQNPINLVTIKDHTAGSPADRDSKLQSVTSGNGEQNPTKLANYDDQGKTAPAETSAPAPAPAPYSEEKNSARPSVGGIPPDSVGLIPGATGAGRRRARKPSEPTPDERAAAMFVLHKLGQRSGVRYSGADEHVRLIVACLRRGIAEVDLRKVIGYCALELEWAEDPDMRKYLRPETLFGPKNIAKYLDAARSWFDANPGLSFDERPKLEVVP